MPLIQRYLFRQLLGPTLLAIAALSAVAVLSQSLSALGILVDQRQSPLVFAKITLLALPQLVVLILPVAILVAALVAMNRLHTEQEVVVCFAAGMSRWRVISPALRLAAIVALVSLILSLWVQPLCYRLLRHTLERVRADLVTSMIKPGRFTHPAPGLTVFAQAVDDDGAIHNLFIDRETPGGRDVTITAREGRLERRAGVPMLVMRRGGNQEFSPTGSLNFLSFDEYVFDLRPLMALDRPVRYKLSDRYLHELFFPDMRQQWDLTNARKMAAEGHSRLAGPLYIVAFTIMAMAAVIGGPFSRTGYAGRIAAVAAAAVVVRTLGFAVQAAAGATPALNAAQYLVPLVAGLAAAGLLFARPARPRAGARVPAATMTGAA
ncbi:MAG: LPS export ABC transporter permease LptF [Caulobacteraceae bacterium]